MSTETQTEEGPRHSAMSEMGIRQLLSQDAIKDRFKEMLGAKAAGFITSVLQVVNGSNQLQNCDPISIYNAAATAATLDLPVVPGLGFAWIVPYKGKAQFQIGYKGFIQLAARTGQYNRINVVEVYANQFKSWNALTEFLDADFGIDGEGEIVGYCAYFRLLSGFEKLIYWTRKKVFLHAQKYSKSFEKENGQWRQDFDAMAMKTVLKAALSKWGILSVEMQRAIRVDQAVILTEDAEKVEYVDNKETAEDKAKMASDATVDAIKAAAEKAKGGATA